MSNNRDDFADKTKKTLAERVAWRCSWPGCKEITIGPNSTDATKSINNGIAAHIHAAAKHGPRYREDMSAENRKHISNGIWMCRKHGNLIDADFEIYSSETLMSWKREAERYAAENLKAINNNYPQDSSTLLQIGSSIIFNSHWKCASPQQWEFIINSPIIGNIETLIEYVSSFNTLSQENRFVIVESQGDARIIKDIKLTEGSTLSFNIEEKSKPTNPELLGVNLALGSNGDLFVEAGNIATVEGVESAIQMLTTTLSVQKGEMIYAKNFGSLASHYYQIYNTDLHLLGKLLKMETIRLSLIPESNNVFKSEKMPPLHFVKRILEVTIESSQLNNNRLNMNLALEWGNGKTWSGKVPVFIGIPA
ncbi:MAG: hypothetical protein PHH59_07480 [Methylovulum sp.]|uniref:hypothetical protein n=1 Tax=Methylovulum sp. TaxID=1916980 RepID=UPI00261F385C|nr:hypothetical protein [Methylovulum sp.]MDD2723850.1 hypothetical protein [Methylovulum sp.]MDD5123728.1 hypothetical protein [Methylovulum sp.]